MRNLKAINEAIYKNVLKESTGVADMAGWAPLIMPLIEKIYPETLVSQIADMQPMSAPVGKVAALYAFYTGDKTAIYNETFLDNSTLIAVSGAPVVADNATIALGGQTVVVRHSEVITYNSYSTSAITNTPATATLFLVSNTVNAPVTATIGSTTLSGVAVIYQTDNRTAIKKIFTKYSHPGSGVPYTQENVEPRHISFETKTITLESKSRKIKTMLPFERLQDFQAIYGDRYAEVVATSVASSIRQEIDKEVIDYMKMAATPMYGVNLANSLGSQSGLFDTSTDIVMNINLAAEQIVKATKRNRTMFVIADPTTIAMLQINPWRVIADPDKDNPFYVGKIGAYPLYCDMYAEDNYCMVGYRFDSDASGDAGLIYAPYTHSFMQMDGANPMFQSHMMTLNRYAYTLHPQDTGNGNSDSDFFRIFFIDYNNIIGLSDNMIKFF